MSYMFSSWELYVMKMNIHGWVICLQCLLSRGVHTNLNVQQRWTVLLIICTAGFENSNFLNQRLIRWQKHYRRALLEKALNGSNATKKCSSNKMAPDHTANTTLQAFSEHFGDCFLGYSDYAWAWPTYLSTQTVITSQDHVDINSIHTLREYFIFCHHKLRIRSLSKHGSSMFPESTAMLLHDATSHPDYVSHISKNICTLNWSIFFGMALYTFLY
jgi:hypothetical protein